MVYYMKETHILAPPRDLVVGVTSIKKWQGLDWCPGLGINISAYVGLEGTIPGGVWAPGHLTSPPMNIRNNQRERATQYFMVAQYPHQKAQKS